MIRRRAGQAAGGIRSGGNNRILLKGGIVLTLDRALGDFETADVLIEGKKIAAVGRNLKADAQAIDASNMIVMPGFVDTHHHQYETILRSILADGLLERAEELRLATSRASSPRSTGPKMRASRSSSPR